MVSRLTAYQRNPRTTLQPARWRTRCPDCGVFSPYGVVCSPCRTARCTVAPVATPPQTTVQLLLRAEAAAPVGFVDVELFIGPDSVDADEVLNPDEFLAYVRQSIAHLTSYANAYEAALAAEEAAV